MENSNTVLKNQLFQKLKPVCDALFQVARGATQDSSNDISLLKATQNLHVVLRQQCCRRNGAFDAQLADYVFLPLSYTLKASQKRLGHVAEAATQCLQVLLEYGWTESIQPQLAHQLLILLTLFAGGGEPPARVSEELGLEALKAITLLSTDIRRSAKARNSLTELSIIPAIGECISTILAAIKNGETTSIQQEALRALGSLWKCINDHQAMATFLPATVSTLTAALQPTTKMPRSDGTLVLGLKTLSSILSATLGDMRVMNLKEEVPEAAEGNLKGAASLTKSWLKATAGQVKQALAIVIKLRKHKSYEVRAELEQFCLSLLSECHSSLEDAASMLVETAMITSSDSNTEAESGFTMRTSLKDLAVLYPEIGDVMKTTAYNWATSLPRIMQASDEDAKAAALKNLSAASDLLRGSVDQSDVLTDTLGSCLKEAAMNSLEIKQASAGIEEASPADVQNLSLTIGSEDMSLQKFSPLLLSHGSQSVTRENFQQLLSHVGSQDTQLKMASSLLEQLPYSSGRELVSSFWLSFQLLKSAAEKSKDLDSFISISLTSSDEVDAAMDEMYNYALTTLSEADDIDEDWRTLAVALEVVAYTSEQQKEAFRPALVDALYPVVELLGCGNQALRDHAITTLNLVSKSCGYDTTSSMIVDNVDYLVNAVSLKLNTFNISPQAPQVLVMMIKLSGPSLLPYLDDVVGSIFAALDNFHGYHKLVDSLFSVLGEIVQESTKSGQLRIESGKEISHRKTPPPTTTLSDILEMLSKTKSKPLIDDPPEHEPFPNRPWKSAIQLLDEADAAKLGEAAEDEEPTQNNEVASIPKTKVYTMVESIARLSQHYLTNPSPRLRLRLLDLLSTASSALYANEDAFLPLINDIWPVVLKRLYDSEPYVVIGAAKTIGKLGEGAGDFMATRIATEWPSLIRLFRVWKKKAEEERKGKHGRGVHAMNWQVWEACIGLMVNLLEYVRVEDAMFEDICEVLGGYLDRRDVRSALETINEDAVVLMDLLAGRFQVPKTPVLEGWTFASVEV